MLKKTSEHRLAFMIVILGVILTGGASVYVKLGLKDMPPFTFTFIRFFLALVFFIPLILKTKFKINKDSIPVFLISLLSTLNIILFSFGIRLTSASIGQLIYALVPILSVIISHYLLNEKITWKKILGILLGFVGMGVIIIPAISNLNTGNSTGLLGNGLIFIGAVSYTFYTILSKKIQKKHSPIYITTAFFITTMLVSFCFSVIEIFAIKNFAALFTPNSLWSLFYVSFFASAVAYLLGQYAIKFGTPLIASLTLYLLPILTVIWAFFILGEVANSQFIIGGTFALVGAWLVSSSK